MAVGGVGEFGFFCALPPLGELVVCVVCPCAGLMGAALAVVDGVIAVGFHREHCLQALWWGGVDEAVQFVVAVSVWPFFGVAFGDVASQVVNLTLEPYYDRPNAK